MLRQEHTGGRPEGHIDIGGIARHTISMPGVGHQVVTIYFVKVIVRSARLYVTYHGYCRGEAIIR